MIPTRIMCIGGLFALALPFTIWPQASAQLEIVGKASVVDGDTIDIHGLRIRLFGIDSPEASQTCKYADGATWYCGLGASQKLRELIAGETLRCEKRDTDRYGRVVAICRAGETDIGGAMVRSGYAVAYYRFSSMYGGDEMAARLARVGIWRGSFQQPEDFRRARQ